MKKIILIISFLFFAILSFAQFPNNSPTGNPNTLYRTLGGYTADGGIVNTRFADTASANTHYIAGQRGAQIIVGNTVYVRDSTAIKWLISGSGGGIVNGTAITSLPTVGFVPSATNPSDWINNVFYQSQAPTASLTGGVNLELRSAQTMNYTLNWIAGRQSATTPLASIFVASVTQTFSQPSAGNSVSGTQAVSFAANTNVTYNNVVTTTDSKATTASTSFSFLPQRYSGWINVSDTAGLGTFGYNDSKITALTNELTASKVKTWNTGNPTGTQIYVYAYYATSGTLNNLILNGFPSIDAFNVSQRNFTNALGFTGQWIIYWNKNGQTLSSDIIAN
jgi:hypothetical protein